MWIRILRPEKTTAQLGTQLWLRRDALRYRPIPHATHSSSTIAKPFRRSCGCHNTPGLIAGGQHGRLDTVNLEVTTRTL